METKASPMSGWRDLSLPKLERSSTRYRENRRGSRRKWNLSQKTTMVRYTAPTRICAGDTVVLETESSSA